MRFLRAVKGCAKRDRYRKDDIRMELDIAESLNDKISQYKNYDSYTCKEWKQLSKNSIEVR